jgi:broad specificity phosphatase PhoE
LPRTQETADIVLSGLEVPRVLLQELNDPLLGDFEQATLDDYENWVKATGLFERPPRGESQIEVVSRYACAFRLLSERPESKLLVICHALPIGVASILISESLPLLRERYDADISHCVPHPLRKRDLARGVARLREEIRDAVMRRPQA